MVYSSEMYIHDLDKKTFDAMNMFPKIIQLREAYVSCFDEKARKIELMSDSIRLGENQMPEVYNLLPPICEKLGIEVPDLYFQKADYINAWTFGTTNPYIVVTSQTVKKTTPRMLSSILAHECGHIACKHSLYHNIAYLLINGVESSPLFMIPAIRKYLTPSLVKAMLLWFRCSELSADRAAVLCDESPDNMMDALLKIHGYGKDIDRKEFLKQAIDLHDFVSVSKANKAIESMITGYDTHPRLAMRVYECNKWSESVKYKSILNGTFLLESNREEVEEKEIVTAELELKTRGVEVSETEIDQALQKVNSELKRYSYQGDDKPVDYAFSILSGLFASVIDSLFVGETLITDTDIGLSHKQVNQFIHKYAEARGIEESRLPKVIKELEDRFKVAQDNVWKGAGIGVSAKEHHLADLAHHPTPIGLVSAIIVQFMRIGTFVNNDGEWHFLLVKTSKNDLVHTIAPAIITGVLNWFACICEKKYEDKNDTEIPKGLKKLIHVMAFSPVIIEIAKCADNWFGHLVSDMGGSNSTAGDGMGIPGIFVSLLYEIASLPGLKNTGLPDFVNDLYVKHKMDLRHEMVIYKSLGKQMIPVLFNEIYVRLGYFVSSLCLEIGNKGVKGVDWSNVIPFRNRNVNRMLMIASMTLSVADTADAAVRAAIESGGNGIVFAGKFVSRFNYVAAGRAAIAIVKEISYERKEAQLIHEKLLLTEAKTEKVVERIEQYKNDLELRLSEYLAEDVSEFMNGFNYMTEGLENGDSDLVIKGNVIIQRVLGREPQFSNQKEFDALMESDDAFVF